MTLCKVNLFLYIITIITIRNVSGICNETFDSLQCKYDVFCLESFYLEKGIRYYRSNSRPDFDDSSCDTVTVFTNYGEEEFYVFHLTYKNDVTDETNIPALNNNHNSDNIYALSLIKFMDLSNNNYEFMPEIKELNNLAVLKLSQNLLTVAKLYNIFEIPSLTELDLSHNTISDIQYDTNYKIYKTLKKIDLSYNYLINIEAKFDQLDKLEELDISHNYIDTLSQSTFEGMKQLLHLNISFNRISDINSSLFRFSELKRLDLSNNIIKEIKSSDFNKLTNLETLDLSSNLLTIIEKNSFHNMPWLRSIYLNKNKLENIDREAFTNVNVLVNVDISENNFKVLPRGLFKSKSIHSFSVKDNMLEGSVEKGTFEGLTFINKLDLSHQQLQSIEDYAFNGLDNLAVLLLNDNNIHVLSIKCFRTMRTLKQLDLSFNKIESIEFERDDLFNLFSLSLRNNHLTVVRHENFHGLSSLQFLDLSDNKITQIETNSFKSLKELINFEISNNPLSGNLAESTFDGLNSLPSLDISCTLLSTVQNGSFIGMVQLKNLNVSHSKINTLEYNIFVHTGAIETIDLSFNALKEFNINSTELVRLDTLYLNNNFMTTLDTATFQSIPRLSKLTLSHNMIQNMNANTFINYRYLRMLDVSYNLNLNFSLVLLNKTKNVDILNVSGIKTGISFGNIKDLSLSQLIMSNSSVLDVKLLQMNELRHLESLSLSHNEIPKLEAGGFNNISTLKNLDVSHNKITYIQPGVFKDNTMLYALNISHNLLTTISYGIFRGLIYLRTLDISFNNINDLQNERFYELSSLSVLIADHNKIESVTADEFLGTRLTQLSIGENPIPCEVLVNFKRVGVPFQITARKLDENNDENVDGVTCNKKSYTFDRITNVGTPTTADNAKILLNIRDILQDLFKNHQNTPPTTNVDEKYMVNITKEFQMSNADVNKKITNFLNATTRVMAKNSETNILLDKILRVLTLNSATKAPPLQVTKDNATYDNLVSYINRVRQELEDSIRLEKNGILNEIEAKISEIKSHDDHNNILLPTETPKHEKLSASADSKSMFTETCVALILIILVCFVLYKVYKSGIFVRKRFSVSTRELPGAMDSAL